MAGRLAWVPEMDGALSAVPETEGGLSAVSLLTAKIDNDIDSSAIASLPRNHRWRFVPCGCLPSVVSSSAWLPPSFGCACFGGTRKGCFVLGSAEDAEDCLPSDGGGATACDGGLRIDDFLTGGMPRAFGAPCSLTIGCLAIGCLAIGCLTIGCLTIGCLTIGAPCSLPRFARGGGGW